MYKKEQTPVPPEEREELKKQLLQQLEGITYKGWIKPFISAYEETGIIGVACKSARIDRRTVEQLRERNAAFAKLMFIAKENSIDMLEAVAKTRAIHGTQKLVLHHGKPVRDPRDPTGQKFLYESKSSDALMIFLLKKYRYPDQVTHTGPDGGPIQVQHSLKQTEVMKKVQNQIRNAPPLALPEAPELEVVTDDALISRGEDDDPDLKELLDEEEKDEE